MAGHDSGTAADLGQAEALGLLRALPHGLAVLDEDGRFAFANEACARLLAWSSGAALVGHSWRELVDAPEAATLEHEGFARARAGEAWRGEALARRKDGVHVPLAIALLPLGGGRLALALDDVSAQRSLEAQLGALAHRDPLTGLPNRRLFEDRLEIALAQAHRYRHRVALIFVDLDRFKQVNDGFGHAAGDELLRGVAERLGQSVREGDTVARLGGDEFTLLLPGIHYAEDLAAISRKLVESLRKPFRLEGREVHVTASGGISLYPEDGEDAETLLKSADTAMYRAKERGRDNFQLFSAAMAEQALERRSLEDSLRKALDKQELTLHYQPCLAARDRTRHGSRGAPALAAARARRDVAQGLHGARRLHGRDAVGRALGARDRLPPGARVAAARLARAAADGQPLGARAAAGRPRGPRREGARRERPARPTRCTSRSPRATRCRTSRARSRRCARCARWACTWRSTASGPASPRSPTCASSRSTRSRSTCRSCAGRPPTPTTPRS